MSSLGGDIGYESQRRGRIAIRLLYGLSVCAIAPSLVSLFARWWWVADLCCHFRVQYTAALFPFVLIAIWLRNWRWFGLIGLVWGWNLLLISPYLLPRPAVQDDQATLRLTTANVFVGNPNHQQFLDFIAQEQPDVMLLLEVGREWKQTLDASFPEYPFRIDSLSDPKFRQSGTFDLMLLSKRPLKNGRILRLGAWKLPVVTVEIEHVGETIVLYGAHPPPPRGADTTTVRDEILTLLGDELADVEGPAMLLGDLNITRWSPSFSQLTKTARLRDASEGFGLHATWPNWLTVPQITIDHVLISNSVHVIDYDIGPPIASDHLPVTVEISLSVEARTREFSLPK
ncbi:MAG: endonuclease/exonuclease/phosphatase family protein [Planctomycetaceae bacterium]